MSRRIFKRFSREKMAGRKLFVPFVTAGDRGLDFTRRAVGVLAQSGADAVELGVPFSDPLADGPIIQRASQRSLERGTTLAGILNLVKDIRKFIEIPIVLMGYLNPFCKPGLENTAKAAARAGVDGFIIPDLPADEATAWMRICSQQDLDTIFLVAPTSTPERIRAVVRASTGFVYYISVTGITGIRRALPSALKGGIAQVRKQTPLPILVGFGISTPQQARQASRVSDGVIVASTLIQHMESARSDAAALQRLGSLSRRIAHAVKNP
jgi:tryptophan synthase alpha chain